LPVGVWYYFRMATIEQIEDFSRFAKAVIEEEGVELSLEDLIGRWQCKTSASDDLLAIQASVDDYERGERGQFAGEVLAEFRSQRSADLNS